MLFKSVYVRIFIFYFCVLACPGRFFLLFVLVQNRYTLHLVQHNRQMTQCSVAIIFLAHICFQCLYFLFCVGFFFSISDKLSISS